MRDFYAKEAARSVYYFSEHEVRYERLRPRLEILDFRKPGTNTYAIRFICLDGKVYVSGDIGDAIYSNYGPGWLLKDWATVELDYFAEKCDASGRGRGSKEWDCGYADESLKCLVAEWDAEDDVDEETKALRKESFKDALQNTATQYEWSKWLEAEGEGLFGSDWWEHSEVGMRIGLRTHLHLIALRMAISKLKSQEPVTEN